MKGFPFLNFFNAKLNLVLNHSMNHNKESTVKYTNTIIFDKKERKIINHTTHTNEKPVLCKMCIKWIPEQKYTQGGFAKTSRNWAKTAKKDKNGPF